MNCTGQVIFREAGRHQNGRRLMMVVGVVAVDDNAPIKGEHQYVIAGVDAGDRLKLAVPTAEGVIDRTADARGCGLGHLVMLPIWSI